MTPSARAATYSQNGRDALFAYARASRDEFERALAELVEIPSVSVEPKHREDVRRAAACAVALLGAMGATATIIETGGHPMVHGKFHRDDRLPTVTVYNHLDVQP